MFMGYRWPARHSQFRGAVGASVLALGLGTAAPPALALKVEEIVSPAGITAWLVEEHSVPLVAINFAFVGGAAQDPSGKEGLTGLVSDLLTEGAGDMPAAAFKDKLSRLGTRLTTTAGRDALYGGLETLSARLKPSVELLRSALVAPRFDGDAVERSRAQRLADLAVAADQPTRVSLERWYVEAFSGSSYGRPLDGTPQTVARLTRDDVVAQHARLLAKDTLRIVIVGDIDKSVAAETIDLVFGGLPGQAKLVPVERVAPRTLPAPLVIDKDYPLATATFGLPSLPSDHPDFAALEVLNHIIGSGDFDSTLMNEIRVKRGLAYAVSISLLSDQAASIMLGGMATKNENMGEALGVLRDVLARTAANGPTPAQFDSAKSYLTGSYLLDFDTNAKLAASLLRIWIDGRDPGFIGERNGLIQRVTLADAKRVAQTALASEAFNVTIVGRPVLPK